MTIGTKRTAEEAEPIAELRNIRAAYGKNPVLSDLSLTLRSGEIFVLMGPNGAGKTTLVRVLIGRLKPVKGSIFGACANQSSSSAVRLVPQDIALFPLLSARENCIAFAKMVGADWRQALSLADHALELTGCKDIASTLVGGLSGGFRRRVNIAVALVGNPRLLILDEPTVGIDAEAKSLITQTINALKETGISILIVTHDFDDADSLADRAGFLFDGRLIRVGAPRDLLSAVFENKKCIEIVLSSLPEQVEQQQLRLLGATPSRSAMIWETFQDLGDKHPAYILMLNDASLPIKEIKISDPGLGALYRHLGGNNPT
jgi:ABC-2 type transport system ATP-binding protein